MECYYHEGKGAVIQCSSCGKGICRDCNEYENNLCFDCYSANRRRYLNNIDKRKRSIIISFIVSFAIFFFMYYYYYIENGGPVTDILWGTLYYGLLFGAMPSGYRCLARLFGGSNNSNGSNNYFFFIGNNILLTIFILLFGGLFILLLVSTVIGPFVLIYEIYQIKKNSKVKDKLYLLSNDTQI